MARLEDLTPGTSLRGILPDTMVTVVAVAWYGSNALELTYKDASGRPATRLLYRDDEPSLAVADAGRPWSFDGDGSLFRLVAEAHRIRLAHLFDPVLAVHTSLVEPLPHQITAVYETMLSRQPLRKLQDGVDKERTGKQRRDPTALDSQASSRPGARDPPRRDHLGRGGPQAWPDRRRDRALERALPVGTDENTLRSQLLNPKTRRSCAYSARLANWSWTSRHR